MGFLMGLSVAFILNVLQPFGTANFQHPNKFWMLSGYGLVIFLTVSGVLGLSSWLHTIAKKERWTIVKEVLHIFLAVILSLVATFFYAKFLFGWKMNWLNFAGYIGYATSVAILPFTFVFGYLYMQWKDVLRSQLEVPQVEEKQESTLLLKGQNKGDQVETTMDELLFAKAHDNYVILYLKTAEKVQRHIIRSTLEQVLQQLHDTRFQRIHRSFLVNLNHVQTLKGNKSKASLLIKHHENGIPVSRKYYDDLKAQFKTQEQTSFPNH